MNPHTAFFYQPIQVLRGSAENPNGQCIPFGGISDSAPRIYGGSVNVPTGFRYLLKSFFDTELFIGSVSSGDGLDRFILFVELQGILKAIFALNADFETEIIRHRSPPA